MAAPRPCYSRMASRPQPSPAVDSGLATSTSEKVWAGGRTVNVKGVRITPAGRVALRR
jgi:hypothetical protein